MSTFHLVRLGTENNLQWFPSNNLQYSRLLFIWHSNVLPLIDETPAMCYFKVLIERFCLLSFQNEVCYRSNFKAFATIFSLFQLNYEKSKKIGTKFSEIRPDFSVIIAFKKVSKFVFALMTFQTILHFITK